jgi:hypothetical protein
MTALGERARRVDDTSGDVDLISVSQGTLGEQVLLDAAAPIRIGEHAPECADDPSLAGVPELSHLTRRIGHPEFLAVPARDRTSRHFNGCNPLTMEELRNRVFESRLDKRRRGGSASSQQSVLAVGVY